MRTSLTSSYGADSSGLVCGYHFDAGGRGHPITSQEALAWLAEPASTAGFAWLHFNLAHAATEKWLRAHLGLSDAFHESLHDGSRSTRVELDEPQ